MHGTSSSEIGEEGRGEGEDTDTPTEKDPHHGDGLEEATLVSFIRGDQMSILGPILHRHWIGKGKQGLHGLHECTYVHT